MFHVANKNTCLGRPTFTFTLCTDSSTEVPTFTHAYRPTINGTTTGPPRKRRYVNRIVSWNESANKLRAARSNIAQQRTRRESRGAPVWRLKFPWHQDRHNTRRYIFRLWPPLTPRPPSPSPPIPCYVFRIWPPLTPPLTPSPQAHHHLQAVSARQTTRSSETLEILKRTTHEEQNNKVDQGVSRRHRGLTEAS